MEEVAALIGLVVGAIIGILFGPLIGESEVNEAIVAQCDATSTYLVANDYQLTCYTPEQIEREELRAQVEELVAILRQR
jgi:uncharacterized membrane protein YoaK (UPF0700 family)